MLGPLFVFFPSLIQAKRTGLRDYGSLASRYVAKFQSKWVYNDKDCDEPLIGTSDIQSLADLMNSYQLIREIRSIPFDKNTVIQLALFTVVPILPLVLTMIPLEELVKKFFAVVF